MTNPGPLIRRMFGPYEHGVTEAYRRIFVDLDELAGLIHAWVPQAQRILEVGCGEGAMTERLARTYPVADITAVDITPRVGRLYRGPASTVTFSQETVEKIAGRMPACFDLVVLADVMHHVPLDSRQSVIRAINQAMAPNGSLIFKDWLISASPIHWICTALERYVTGDDVSYFTVDAIKTLLASTFACDAIGEVATVRPWPNNVAILVRR